jgi:hypothetical protein
MVVIDLQPAAAAPAVTATASASSLSPLSSLSSGRVLRLHLVDLAGSERSSLKHASSGLQKETNSINQSLSALSNCIVALASGQPHVPLYVVA